MKFKPPSIHILLAIFRKGLCLILSFPRKIPPHTHTYLDAVDVIEKSDLSEEEKLVEKSKLLEARKLAFETRFEFFPP